MCRLRAASRAASKTARNEIRRRGKRKRVNSQSISRIRISERHNVDDVDSVDFDELVLDGHEESIRQREATPDSDPGLHQDRPKSQFDYDPDDAVAKDPVTELAWSQFGDRIRLQVNQELQSGSPRSRLHLQADLANPYSVSGFRTRMRLRVASSGAHTGRRSNSSASSGL